MKHTAYKTFLRNYYLYSSLYDLIFAYPIYNVMFHMRGMTVLQISLLLAWWAGIAMVAEIPSGALADYWSRQKLLVIAPLIKALCFVIWYFGGGNFSLFALGFLFWGVGSSFRSGTTEALLYDHLVFFDKRHEYEKVLGRKKFYYYIALTLSLVTGGIIAHYSIDWALLLSVLPLLLASLFAALINDVPKTESTGEIHYLEYIKIAAQEIRANTTLRYILIYGVGISIFGVLEEFDQLYYELAGLPIWAFGIIGSIGTGLNAVSSLYSYKFKGRPRAHYLLLSLSALFLGIVGLFPSIPVIGLLLLAYVVVEPLNVLIDSRLQHSITSVSRATITSVNNLLLCFFGIVTMPLLGLISKMWNFQAIYVSCGGWMLLLTGWVILNRHHLRLSSPSTEETSRNT
jgi:MFS family permease